MSRDEFDFDIDDSEVEQMLKKARWRQLFKMILISSVAFIVLFIGGIIGIIKLQDRAFFNMHNEIHDMNAITRPNIELGEFVRNDGLLTSTVEYTAYKVIEEQPVRWADEVYTFKTWNTFRRLSSGGLLSIGEDNHVYNNQTMQREMQFYLPFVSYPDYMNEVEKLHDENTVAELTISFDKPYTVTEIQEMLPEGVHPVWYWVDTYTHKDYYKEINRKESLPESAYDVYGFSRKEQTNIDGGNGTEKDFLLAIESGLEAEGKYYDEYKRLYNYLRGDKKKPTEEDVKIFGVVVTGTEAALGQLHEASYAKATVLGATAEKR